MGRHASDYTITCLYGDEVHDRIEQGLGGCDDETRPGPEGGPP